MKQTLKRAINCMALLLFIGFYSCHDDEGETHVHEQLNQRKVTLTELPFLQQDIAQRRQAATARDAGDYLDLIDPGNIIEITNPDDGSVTYTFGLNIHEADTLTNLFVVVKGSVYEYFVIQYASPQLEEWKTAIAGQEQTGIDIAYTVERLDAPSQRSGEPCFSQGWQCPSGMHRSGQEAQCTFAAHEWYYVTFQVPCDDGSGGSEGGGGTGGSGGTGGGGGVTTPVIPAPRNPCIDLKAKSENTEYKAKMLELKAKAADQNFESGYITYASMPQFSPEYTGDENDENGSAVTIPFDPNRTDPTGIIHCHLDDPAKKNFAVFTLSDLIGFAMLMKYSTAPTASFTLMVTNAKGTFALKITNKTAFLNMAQALADLGEVGEGLFEIMVQKDQSVNVQVKNFLMYFKLNTDTAIKNTGFELYRADMPGFDNWHKLELDTNNNITERKC